MERELWSILSKNIARLERKYHNEARTHQTGRVVRVFLWAALHDRPTYWACERRNWVGVKPPRHLPDQSTMSRRLRCKDTEQMLDELAQRLNDLGYESLVHYVDGKPLTVSRHSIDADARHGRGAGGMDRGYKLHAIYTENNRPIAWEVTPLNQKESKVAARLLEGQSVSSYLLADGAYDANHLYDRVAEQGGCFLAAKARPNARGIGHHRHSPHRIEALQRLAKPSDFVADLVNERRRVETRFAHLTNFGGGLTCLPPWVRTLPRVSKWVTAKILIRLARDQNQRTTDA